MAARVLACLSLLFADDREAGFWLDGPGRAHVLAVLTALADLVGPGRVVVLTRPDRPVPVPGPTCLPVAGIEPGEGLFPLPAALLAALLAPLAPEPDTWLLWIDVRNPSLTAAVLEKAVAGCREGKTPLRVSVWAPEDHPCQFQRYYRVLDAGLIHRLESVPPGAAVLRTAPLAGADGTWARGRELPVADPSALARQRRTPCGLFHADCAATSLPPAACRRVFRDAAGRLHVRFPRRNEPASHLAIQPLGPGRPGPLLATLPRGGEPEAVFDLDPAGLDGLLYALLTAVPGGPHDLVDRMPPLEGLWTWDAQGASLRADDGRQILGRQDFPEVFEATGDLVAVPISRLSDVQGLLARGEAAGFVLSQPGISIASDKDCRLAVLRLEVQAQETAALPGAGQESE